MKKSFLITVFLFIFILFYWSCDALIINKDLSEKELATPKIDSITPTAVYSNALNHKVHIRGSGFNEKSIVLLNGTEISSYYRKMSFNYEFNFSISKDVISNYSTSLSVQIKNTSDIPNSNPKFSNIIKLNIRNDFIKFEDNSIEILHSEHDQIISDIDIDSNDNINILFYRNINGKTIFYYSISLDNGLTWSQPNEVLNRLQSKESLPYKIIKTSTNHIYVIWHEKTEVEMQYKNQYSRDIYFCKSLDNGDSWTSSKKIISNANISGVNYTKFDDLIVSYLITKDNTSTLFNAITSDLGENWNHNLINKINDNIYESKFIIDEYINYHHFYRDANSAIYNRSVDQGLSWPDFIYRESSSNSEHISIKVFKNNIYLLWHLQEGFRSASSSDTFFGSSNNSGETWIEKFKLDDLYPMPRDNFEMVVDKTGIIYVLLNNFIIRSEDMGKTWFPPQFVPFSNSSQFIRKTHGRVNSKNVLFFFYSSSEYNSYLIKTKIN